MRRNKLIVGAAVALTFAGGSLAGAGAASAEDASDFLYDVRTNGRIAGPDAQLVALGDQACARQRAGSIGCPDGQRDLLQHATQEPSGRRSSSTTRRCYSCVDLNSRPQTRPRSRHLRTQCLRGAIRQRGEIRAGSRSTRWIDKALTRLLHLPPPTTEYTVHRDVAVPMRDGITLLADHYAPTTSTPAGTILLRGPYGRGRFAAFQTAYVYCARGYHVVLQSVRGTFGSGGDFEPGRREVEDGADTVAWLRDQPWFTGRLATMGGSYLGFTQWAMLVDPPPNCPPPSSPSDHMTSGKWCGEVVRSCSATSSAGVISWPIRRTAVSSPSSWVLPAAGVSIPRWPHCRSGQPPRRFSATRRRGTRRGWRTPIPRPNTGGRRGCTPRWTTWTSRCCWSPAGRTSSSTSRCANIRSCGRVTATSRSRSVHGRTARSAVPAPAAPP